jgi:hypothetical protein
MSAFHSPRCRIVFTMLICNGVVRDVAAPDQPISMVVGAEVNPTLQTDPGFWVFNWNVSSVNLPGEAYTAFHWIGLNSNFPVVGSLVATVTWTQATQVVTGSEGIWLFQPELRFNLSGKGRDEFAVVEEPHNFLIEF